MPDEDPFAGHLVAGVFDYRGAGWWPARWIAPAAGSCLAADFHLAFHLDRARRLRLHLSADEIAELRVDGRFLTRFPERGEPCAWFFRSQELDLAAGTHHLAVRVWRLGEAGQEGQTSRGLGLLACPDPGDPLLSALATGFAPWRCRALAGVAVDTPAGLPAAAPAVTQSLAGDPEAAWRGEGAGWYPPQTDGHGRSRAGAGQWRDDDRLLQPAALPDLLAGPIAGLRLVHLAAGAEEGGPRPFRTAEHLAPEAPGWEGLLAGRPLLLPAGTRRRALIALPRYACFRPCLEVAGGAGAELRLTCAEGLYRDPQVHGHTKGQREAWEGLHLLARHDAWRLADGWPRSLDLPDWRCGRWLGLEIAVGAEPLVLHALRLEETRYPLAECAVPETDDPVLDRLGAACLRSLQCCAHDTYQDCPYYERNQWLADARVQALCGYCLQLDDRLPRKALRQFADSVRQAGLPLATHPGRHPLIIPSFAPWFVGMLHDHALWRGDPALLGELMPMARLTLDRLLAGGGDDGLVLGRPGWNYLDWIHASGWRCGIPPDGERGVSAAVNWQLVWILRQAAELEDLLDESELAARWRRRATALAAACDAVFWDEARGLYADDRARAHASEHAQVMALLAGIADPQRRARCAQALVGEPALARTQLFFTHYLFECLAALGQTGRIWPRLDPWRRQLALGLDTTPEHSDPTRSDCHGWSAHPRFHLVASVAGLRPAGFGFTRLRCDPVLGPLRRLRIALPHPRGLIVADLHADGGAVTGSLTLPEGLAVELGPGAQGLALRRSPGGASPDRP